MMMIRPRLPRSGGVAALEELFVTLHLHVLFWRPGIQFLHFSDLLGCDLREMPNEMDESPGEATRFGGPVAPAGHSGEADAIFNDPEKLAVAERLRRRERHVGRSWIHMLP